MEFTEDLQELGLAKNEGKVYLTLIEYGKLSASDVAAKSGVSYSRIYNVLAALAHRGLVVTIPERTKKYSPASPESFLNMISKKEELLRKARERVKEMKRFYEIKEKQPVQIALGRAGFYKLVDEMKFKIDNYEYDIKWNMDVRPEWLRNTEKSLKRGADIKILTRCDNETKKNVDKWLKVNKEIRKIENEGVALSIVDDEEVLIGLIKSDSTLLIRDKPFAKLMKKMFLETYKDAELIN